MLPHVPFLFVQEYKYRSKIDNVYRNSIYNNELPQFDRRPPEGDNPFVDFYANSSFAPRRPLRQEWTYIRSDFRIFRFNEEAPEPFALFLDEVETVMGRRSGLQVTLCGLLHLPIRASLRGHAVIVTIDYSDSCFAP